MDNLEYLQHISQSNRPVTPAKPANSLPMGLIGKILLGGVVLTALLIGFGVLAGNRSNKSDELTQQLYLRINNVNQTISANNSALKSSQLRSINATLSSVLTNTSNQLASYAAASLPSDDEESPLTPSADVLASETALITNLNNTLAKAKLNGILNRIYASQIHLQVSLLLSMTSELTNRTDDPDLLQILGQFYSSLSVIEQSLDTYSNPSA